MTDDIYIHNDESDEFIGRLIQSFDMTIEDLGLRNGMTFQELIDNITARLGKQPSTNCSTQIVFYKLRQIMTKELGVNKHKITRHALINDLFPKRTRKADFRKLGQILNIDISYFQAPGWIQLTCVVSLFAGFVFLFFQPLYGGLLIAVSLFVVSVSHKLSRSIPMKTFGEFVDRLTRDNLVKLQPDKNSINDRDIRMTVIKLIDDLHALDKLEINSSQKIIFE